MFGVKLWDYWELKSRENLTCVQDSIKAGWCRSWGAIVVVAIVAIVVVRPTWTLLVVIRAWTLAEAWVCTPSESWTWSLVESGTLVRSLAESRPLVETSAPRLIPRLILAPGLRVWNVNLRFKIWGFRHCHVFHSPVLLLLLLGCILLHLPEHDAVIDLKLNDLYKISYIVPCISLRFDHT